MTLIHWDIQLCDNNCMCDYVEILGQRFCGTYNWTGSVVSCENVVRFSSDESITLSGFRAEWTEIPGDVE